MSEWSAFDDLDKSVPGAMAAVVSSGSIIASASFGSTRPGGDPLGDRTPFYVASIAKQFTAAAIGILALDGRLSLHDPVRRWLPELPARWGPVTLHHLLSHTGGLPDGNPADIRAGWGVHSDMTTWDRIAVIATISPESPPGAVHRYGNHGYVLLAGVVERATDQRLGAFARTALFEPLEMVDTRFLDTAGVAAVPGWIDGRQRVDIHFSCCGDGGLVTTLVDLARWDGWLPTSRLAPLMLADRPVLPNGRTAHDAWGISIRRHHGLRIESHGGSIDGYMASFVRFPSESTSFVVLANTDQFGPHDLARRAQHVTQAVIGHRLDHRKPSWTETHGEPL